MAPSFDAFSKNYNDQLNNALRVTGYDASLLTQAKLKKLRQLFPNLASAKFNLLDFGCGIGNLYESLHKFFPHASYTGVDQSEESIVQARTHFANQSLFHSLHATDWKHCQYDLIFSAGVFHHIPHDQHIDILKELTSLLKPNGKLAIWEHNPLNPFTRKIVRDCIFDEDAVLIPPALMKKTLSEVQLAEIQVIYTTFFPKTLSFLNVLDPYLSWLPLGGQFVTIAENRAK